MMANSMYERSKIDLGSMDKLDRRHHGKSPLGLKIFSDASVLGGEPTLSSDLSLRLWLIQLNSASVLMCETSLTDAGRTGFRYLLSLSPPPLPLPLYFLGGACNS